MRSTQAVRLLCALLAGGVGAAGAPALGEDAAAPEASAPVVAPLPPPVEPVALSDDAIEIRDGLPAALAALPADRRAAVEAFYLARTWAPFWTAPGSRLPADLVATLDAAGDQALPAVRYDAPALAALFEPASAASPAEREAAAMAAYLRLAADLSSGIVDPVSLDPEYIGRKPERPSPGALLAALDSAPLPDVLRGLEPTDPDYRRMVEEKARLQALAATESWGPEVAGGDTLHPGDSDPRVAELRARLARLGYLPASGEAVAPTFDDALKAAVERFQADYGLVADGVVGKATLAAVNAPVATRLAQLAVNLERMRWMPRDLGPRYLWVNIPDFTVHLVDGGASVWESKVVVGKTRVTETPEFDGTVSYLVVNPSWHIPDSIAIRDYLPKLQRNPMVLKNQGIDLMTRSGTVINPKLVDFTQYTPENFPFRIKQRPSDDNALGQVKFMFPNRFSVYMHDTPHKELFPREVRAFSNGCIRLEKPRELAEILLAGQTADPAATYDALLASGKERHVDLERTIPVHIVYRTAWFDDDGTARYRPDVYGRDARLFEAMEAKGVTMAAAQG
jgi:murein L,D-transpeptidase YcbB/YkuD